MRIFVTGPTGYLGSAIAARFARADHLVSGLTRGAAQGRPVPAGVRAVSGDLADPDSFLSEMKNCDAVVHAAFDDAEQAAQIDQRTLETIAAAAQDGRVRRLLYTSGVWVHGDTAGRAVDETEPLDPADHVKWRPAHEAVALGLSAHEVETMIFRPGIVYGETRGFLGEWFQEARDHRTISIPGEGAQHWPLVHRDDVAEAYLLGLEHGRSGERYLLADGSSFTVRELAEAVANVTGAAIREHPPGEVLKRMGSSGAARLMDQRINAGKARRELGWVPRHTSFVGEIESIFRDWLAGEQAGVR